jgi:uncharacterized protein YegP (UPF0339 family)
MTNPMRTVVLVAALAALVLAGSAAAQKGKGKGGKLTFEIYKDKGEEYRWRLKTADDKILAVPEDAYKGASGAKDAVANIKKNATSKKWKTEVYKDEGGKFRWRLKAANGAVMARPTKGYDDEAEAKKALDAFRKGVKSAAVVEKK